MMRMNKTSYLAVSAAFFVVCGLPVVTWLSNGDAHAAEETSSDILAARVREQGFTCDKAQSSEREQSQSEPNETVWILKCENDTYRLRLVPDMAAKIEPIKNK
jgi:hypothetical protein